MSYSACGPGDGSRHLSISISAPDLGMKTRSSGSRPMMQLTTSVPSAVRTGRLRMGTHPCPGHCLRDRGQCRAPVPRWADDLRKRCARGGSSARGAGAWPASPPA
eukprot:5232910-Lingulodinium_polyedra.AAC.1